jgi:hypothetical protein
LALTLLAVPVVKEALALAAGLLAVEVDVVGRLIQGENFSTRKARPKSLGIGRTQ